MQQRAWALSNHEISRIQFDATWSFKDWLTACSWPEVPTPNAEHPYNRVFVLCYGLLVRDGVEHLITVQNHIYESGYAYVGNMIIWDADTVHTVPRYLVPYDPNNQILPD
jgi:hypothetical protein